MTGQELYDTWCSYLSIHKARDGSLKPLNWWFLPWAEREAWTQTARDIRVLAGEEPPPDELDSTSIPF